MNGERQFAAPALEISAIVVSYNTREMTLDCLRTLDAELRGIEAEIIVVDNASHDGSVEAMRAAFPAGARHRERDERRLRRRQQPRDEGSARPNISCC